MNRNFRRSTLASALLLLMGGAGNAGAAAFIQCPGDTNADAIPDGPVLDGNGAPRQIKCMHLSSGDGFVNMADGKLQYIFSFSACRRPIPSAPASWRRIFRHRPSCWTKAMSSISP